MGLVLRSALVWLVATATFVGVGWWSLGAVVPANRFDDLVTSAAGLALAGCAAWAWLVCTVVVAQTVRRGGPVLRAVPGVPGWAARAVLAACGVAALAVVPAHASYDVRPGQAAAPSSTLDGLPFPDRAVGPAHGPTRPTAERAEAQQAHAVVVRPGDSLWRIAASHLAPGATDGEVAAATTALLDLNRAVVGPDPDLIQPGLRLRTPGS